jgi:hypothetical protein
MSDDDTYEIPLQDQRIFGAGIKRQRVKFVPSASSSSNIAPPNTSSAKSIGDLYLSLVLPGNNSKEKASNTSAADSESASSSQRAPEDPSSQICEICSLPLTSDQETATVSANGQSSNSSISKPKPHEASLAHQVCLAHSHPPSHLDRNRKGLAYLSQYGWDPDSRVGLGATGQGIQFPIKTKPKDDKLGIGVVVPKDLDKMKKVKEVKLDAGKIRKMQESERRRTEKLREMFYRSEDLEKYLGKG